MPPATPKGVQVVVSASNALTISWSPSANTVSYNIYYATSPGTNKNSTKLACNSSATCTCSTPTSCTHTGLTTGNTYYYVVTAVNSYGESAISAEVYAQLAAPHPPGGVAAVSGNGEVTLTWITSGANSYNVYMASQSSVTKANYASLPDGAVYASATGSYTQTGLTNGKTYYFVVTSVNGIFGESSESSEVSVTPAANSSPTVSGVVKYEDKEYGLNGFTGKTTYKGVRYADVEAVDAAGLTVASAATDATGAYNMTLPSASSVYIRVISSASSPLSSSTPLVSVRDLSNSLYAVSGPGFTASGSSMENISIPAANPAAGAFNELDVFTTGAQFFQSFSGSYPPELAAYWQAGNAAGTYYCNGTPDISCPYGEGIYILSYNGDTDEYDDDVLWHEFGHFIANHFSRDDSPGGVHYLDTNDLDLRLSWSEGWGDFFPTAVKNWLSATPSMTQLLSTAGIASSVYVDTWGGSASYFDFGNPGGAPYIYASNEVAIAKILIGLRSNFSMNDIWDIFSSPGMKNANEQINFEVFWDTWNVFPKADITATLIDRSIYYSADNFEALSDNTPNGARMAALGVAENHTLFGGQDVDYVAFSATQGTAYTAKTTSLKNGADTVIRIIAPDLTTEIVANDNANGANYANSVPNNCDQWGECHENNLFILGSTASFTATGTGTYYVEVKSSASRPLSAGKYGGYTLTITSP